MYGCFPALIPERVIVTTEPDAGSADDTIRGMRGAPFSVPTYPPGAVHISMRRSYRFPSP